MGSRVGGSEPAQGQQLSKGRQHREDGLRAAGDTVAVAGAQR